ncbi:hypothetical protein JCM24511_02204 [Saitozyma sp. JCM 24511]|nr:hypothetical protein JCM24511_02204 [Saitozyma sp. JCM 24511]
MSVSGQEQRLLWWDADKNEPYLAVPGFPDLRITPFHKEDDPHLVELYNDPLIGSWAWRRPYPYLLADRDFVWNVLYPPQRAAMELLKPLLTLPSEASSGAQGGAHPLPSPPPTTPVFPLGVVRDIHTGHIAGDLSIFPDTSPAPATVPDSAGHGDIPATPGPSGNLEAGRGGTPHRWEVAYNVDERYRGRGLAVAMLKAVITGWCVWVGMETLIAHVETRNTGSQSVVRRCGFQLVDLEQREWPADKGGGTRELGLWVLDLKRVGSGSGSEA